MSSRAAPRAPPVVAAGRGIDDDEEAADGGGADYCGLRAHARGVHVRHGGALAGGVADCRRLAIGLRRLWAALRRPILHSAVAPLRAPPPPNATAPPAVLLLGDDCRAVGGGGGGVRRVGFAWEPSKGRTLYHQRGARLGAMVRSEALAAALGPRAVARVSQMNSARGYREGAAAFAAAGFAPGGVRSSCAARESGAEELHGGDEGAPRGRYVRYVPK